MAVNDEVRSMMIYRLSEKESRGYSPGRQEPEKVYFSLVMLDSMVTHSNLDQQLSMK
jgi:hypothetical protein